MINTNTAPSAETKVKSEWSLDKCFEQLRFDERVHLGLGDIRLTIAVQEEICKLVERNKNEHTRLHLEAMRDSFCKEEYLDVDRNNIREAVNTYIKNNKL